jgi:hypothetical protein
MEVAHPEQSEHDDTSVTSNSWRHKQFLPATTKWIPILDDTTVGRLAIMVKVEETGSKLLEAQGNTNKEHHQWMRLN